MNTLVESLKRLYVAGKVTKEKINSMNLSAEEKTYILE